MLLSELLERLDGFTDSEMDVYLSALLEVLTPVSHSTLLYFQGDQYDGSPIAKKELHAEIRQCVELEQSELGETIRATFDLEPLTMETTIG